MCCNGIVNGIVEMAVGNGCMTGIGVPVCINIEAINTGEIKVTIVCFNIGAHFEINQAFIGAVKFDICEINIIFISNINQPVNGGNLYVVISRVAGSKIHGELLCILVITPVT